MRTQIRPRLLWILNHKTLMPDEVGIIRSLGWQVFTPKVLPRGFDSRSSSLERSDDHLGIAPEALDVLKRHRFYERHWPPTVSSIINQYFDVVVTAFYQESFASAVHDFDGLIIARAFGREGSSNYEQLISHWDTQLLRAISQLRDRFVFGQAYDNISSVEGATLRSRAITLPLCAPSWVSPAAGNWHGSEPCVLFFCPMIATIPYYREIFDRIKRDFADVPHIIFGKQQSVVEDPTVRGNVSDSDLRDLYAACRLFVYPSVEERHLHYGPIEAMIVGAPVLYFKGTMLDTQAGGPTAGACTDIHEMRAKTFSLLSGDRALAREIQQSQQRVLSRFDSGRTRGAWAAVLAKARRTSRC